MNETDLPFEVKHLGGKRYRVYLDSFWDAARTYARAAGYPKEEGKYQGTPPI